MLLGIADRRLCLLPGLLLGNLQLLLEMDLRCREEYVDAVDVAFEGRIDVVLGGPAESAYLCLQASSRDPLHRIGLALGIDGEPCFDDVHSELVQCLRYLQLVLAGKGDIRRLLPVPQRRVEDLDPFRHPRRGEDLLVVFTHEHARVGYLERYICLVSSTFTRSLWRHHHTLQKFHTAAFKLE